MALTKKAREFQIEVVKQMLTLATSGFGLVAALAWNELIKAVIDTYVKPYFPQGSGVISLLLYAVLVTTLVVLVTVNLAKFKQRLEAENEKKGSKKK